MEPEGADDGAIAIDDLRERGRARDAAEVAERAARGHAARTRTPSSTRPARPARRRAACSRTATTATSAAWSRPSGVLGTERRGRRLPLPAAGALLRAADPARVASTSASRSPTSAATRSRSSPSWSRSSRPTCRRCRASSRRSTRWSPAAPATRRSIRKATEVGMQVRKLEQRRAAGPGRAAGRLRPVRREDLRPTSAAAFGGRLRQATTGAAPIAKEILEFFYAAGVPVFEGYGMTETATAATDLDARRLQLRDRRPAAARAARSGSPRTARS